MCLKHTSLPLKREASMDSYTKNMRYLKLLRRELTEAQIEALRTRRVEDLLNSVTHEQSIANAIDAAGKAVVAKLESESREAQATVRAQTKADKEWKARRLAAKAKRAA